MNYEMMTLFIVAAIPLAAGLALIADGARRAVREAWEANRDLHV
jgi:hypothetical protein